MEGGAAALCAAMWPLTPVRAGGVDFRRERPVLEGGGPAVRAREEERRFYAYYLERVLGRLRRLNPSGASSEVVRAPGTREESYRTPAEVAQVYRWLGEEAARGMLMRLAEIDARLRNQEHTGRGLGHLRQGPGEDPVQSNRDSLRRKSSSCPRCRRSTAPRPRSCAGRRTAWWCPWWRMRTPGRVRTPPRTPCSGSGARPCPPPEGPPSGPWGGEVGDQSTGRMGTLVLFGSHFTVDTQVITFRLVNPASYFDIKCSSIYKSHRGQVTDPFATYRFLIFF
jgi:hypothetical protein